MLRRSRPVAALLAGLLLVSACGSKAAPTADAPESSAVVTTPDAEPVTTTPTASSPANAATDTNAAPDEQASAPTATQPAPAAAPDEGCSADNSPTTPDFAEGPLPSIEVGPESVGNPLPDLAVRRINCAGGWVNLKNEIPADTPLLIWFWAPH